MKPLQIIVVSTLFIALFAPQTFGSEADRDSAYESYSREMGIEDALLHHNPLSAFLITALGTWLGCMAGILRDEVIMRDIAIGGVLGSVPGFAFAGLWPIPPPKTNEDVLYESYAEGYKQQARSMYLEMAFAGFFLTGFTTWLINLFIVAGN
jgi:hypothetical protein